MHKHFGRVLLLFQTIPVLISLAHAQSTILDPYLVTNKLNMEEALKYEDRSIQNEERFDNLITKSQVLEALGRKDEATDIRNKAISMANALQLHGLRRHPIRTRCTAPTREAGCASWLAQSHLC